MGSELSYRSVQEIIGDLEANPAERGGHLYHPIPFPEFDHLKTSTRRAQVLRKWDLIRRALGAFFPNGPAGLRVLDVGAGAGFYAFRLAMEGARVTAFEPHPRYGPIGAFLAKEKKLAVEWFLRDFDAAEISGRRFDAALVLSVFQWMADGGLRSNEAAEKLRAIAAASRCLFFELGFNRGKSCMTTSRLNHYAEVIALLKAHTGYERFHFLGKTAVWRFSPRYLVLASHDARFDDSIWRRWLRDVRI